jgi:hypothetical protein
MKTNVFNKDKFFQYELCKKKKTEKVFDECLQILLFNKELRRVQNGMRRVSFFDSVDPF